MISNLLQALFNMADIAVVGQFSGPIALGAVGSTVILVGVFTGILIGMGSGVNAICARQKAFCFALHIHLRQERC